MPSPNEIANTVGSALLIPVKYILPPEELTETFLEAELI